MKLLVGCDPEIMIKDRFTGQFVSGHDLCPGSKEEPHKVRKGAVQVDGLALEINIDPASSEDEFVENVDTVLEELRGIVPKRYDFVFQPSVMFDKEYFNGLPEKVKELGCNPDWSAYLGAKNERPAGEATTMRTGAGHIHIGWFDKDNFVSEEDSAHIGMCSELVKFMDHFVGMECLNWDKDVTRRLLYGKAGAFRPKKYGVEYRTPSNAWLNSDEYKRRVYRKTLEACDAFINETYKITEESNQMVLKALGA